MPGVRYVSRAGRRARLRLYGAGRRRGKGRSVRGRGRRGRLRSAADPSVRDARGAWGRCEWRWGAGRGCRARLFRGWHSRVRQSRGRQSRGRQSRGRQSRGRQSRGRGGVWATAGVGAGDPLDRSPAGSGDSATVGGCGAVRGGGGGRSWRVRRVWLLGLYGLYGPCRLPGLGLAGLAGPGALLAGRGSAPSAVRRPAVRRRTGTPAARRARSGRSRRSRWSRWSRRSPCGPVRGDGRRGGRGGRRSTRGGPALARQAATGRGPA